jgi:hypothetical protein
MSAGSNGYRRRWELNWSRSIFRIRTFPRTVGEGASVAETVPASMYDEDREKCVDRTIGIERSVELARAWDTEDSEDFENRVRDIADLLYELGDRAARVEQGEAGAAHFLAPEDLLWNADSTLWLWGHLFPDQIRMRDGSTRNDTVWPPLESASNAAPDQGSRTMICWKSSCCDTHGGAMLGKRGIVNGFSHSVAYEMCKLFPA